MNIPDLIKICDGETDFHRVSMQDLYEKAWKSWLDDFDLDEPKEERVKSLKTQGLTSEDGFYIWSYTGSSSSWLNSDKRNCNEYSSDCKKAFYQGLMNAMSKLPSFEEKVFRWEEADENQKKFNWFKDNIGKTGTVPYFLSTSKDDVTSRPMIWEIKTKKEGSGRDISSISNNLYEQEVLFLPNTKLKIIGVGDDMRTVYLEEVELESKSDFDFCRSYYLDLSEFTSDEEPGLFD